MRSVIGLHTNDSSVSLEKVAELVQANLTLAERLRNARQETATDLTNEQKESGRYKKGVFRWHGLVIKIENPKGSTRSGTSDDGKTWSTKMKHDYGFFDGTTDRDGDQVDCFIGPSLESELVHVINQVIGNKFDEHKVIIGATSEAEAREIYLANYEAGWQGLGSVKAMTLPSFKEWLADEEATLKRASDYDLKLKNLRKRRGECPGCGKQFKVDEPYPDVENCEVCERYGSPKE